MKSLQAKDNLIWIDLEMTGLDPEKERIIEIATLITDSQLNILAEGPNIIINQPKSLLDQMDDWTHFPRVLATVFSLAKSPLSASLTASVIS